MGLLGLLIAVLIIILLFVFTNLSNSSVSTFTPKNSKILQNKAQEIMDNTSEKAKQQQDQIKNIDVP